MYNCDQKPNILLRGAQVTFPSSTRPTPSACLLTARHFGQARPDSFQQPQLGPTNPELLEAPLSDTASVGSKQDPDILLSHHST